MIIAENVVATPTLLETNVPNALLNILHSQLVKFVCAMLRDLKITLVMKMENAFVTLTLLETSVINVMVDFLDSLLVERHVNVTMKDPQSTIVTKMACVHAKKTLSETNVTPVWKDTPISQTVTSVITDTMALEVVDILMKDMIMNMM